MLCNRIAKPCSSTSQTFPVGGMGREGTAVTMIIILEIVDAVSVQSKPLTDRLGMTCCVFHYVHECLQGSLSTSFVACLGQGLKPQPRLHSHSIPLPSSFLLFLPLSSLSTASSLSSPCFPFFFCTAPPFELRTVPLSVAPCPFRHITQPTGNTPLS